MKKEEFYQTPRVNYKLKDSSTCVNVAEAITKWLLEGSRNGKHERIIRSLKLKLEHQHEYHTKVKRKLENDIKDMLDNKEKYIRKCYGDVKPKYDPKKRSSPKEEKKLSVIDLLGVRKKVGAAQSEKGHKRDSPLSKDTTEIENGDKHSSFSFTENILKDDKKIDEDFRQRKIKEREEELKKEKYEEFKRQKDIDNQKNLNIESIKRREEMKRRREATGTFGDRMANIGIRTPHDNGKQSRPTTTYVRNGRRTQQGFWKSLVNQDFCTIF